MRSRWPNGIGTSWKRPALAAIAAAYALQLLILQPAHELLESAPHDACDACSAPLEGHDASTWIRKALTHNHPIHDESVCVVCQGAHRHALILPAAPPSAGAALVETRLPRPATAPNPAVRHLVESRGPPSEPS